MASQRVTYNTGGVFIPLLTTLFVGLKLTGHIDWLIVAGVIFVVALTVKGLTQSENPLYWTTQGRQRSRPWTTISTVTSPPSTASSPGSSPATRPATRPTTGPLMRSTGPNTSSWKMGGATVIVGAEKALPLLKSLIMYAGSR